MLEFCRLADVAANPQAMRARARITRSSGGVTGNGS